MICVGLVGLLVFAGCRGADVAPTTGVTDSTAPATSRPADTIQPGPVSVEVAAVCEQVRYSGACGNETVVVGGTTYYPILYEASSRPDGQATPIDLGRYPVVGALVGIFGSVGAVPVVAPLRPGDDIGEMIVYVDGTARFESDSGRVIWLTDREQTSGWEC